MARSQKATGMGGSSPQKGTEEVALVLRSAVSKVMWVGRATVFLVGLAVILAVVLGVASTAFGSNGQAFSLGRINTASAVSSLIKSGVGPALDLKVDSGPPLAVNSSTKVTDLNADQLDGKNDTDFYAAGSKVADSDKLDGLDSTNFVAYKRTVVVSPVGTPQENGTALRNAMQSVRGKASVSNPYLVKLEPGVYDLGASGMGGVTPGIAIEGSGQSSTKILRSGGSNTAVTLWNDAELRFLTVENISSGEDPFPFVVNDAISTAARDEPGIQGPSQITHVTAMASGGERHNVGLFVGSDTRVVVNDSTVRASGGTTTTWGVDGWPDGNTHLTLNDTIVTSRNGECQSLSHCGGIHVMGFAVIKDSQITSDGPTIVNNAPFTDPVNAAAVSTILDGPPVENRTGTLKCAGVFDEDIRFFADTCP